MSSENFGFLWLGLVSVLIRTQFSTSPHGEEFHFALAVNGGDSDHFSLCQRSNGNEFVVIYGGVESNSTRAGYKWETCVEVAIHVLPEVTIKQKSVLFCVLDRGCMSLALK